LPDEKRFVPDFQLVVDGAAADPELKGSVLGIRVTDDMDKASRFWVHLSDVGRKWTRQDKFKPGTAVEIKLGYQGQLKSVCKGEISSIEMVLTPDGPTRVIVAGFEPNDETLWKRVSRNISAFLLRIYNSGALMGKTPEEAFYVKCDSETNPPEVVDAGQMVCEIGIAPVKPAEFVIFRIGQMAGQAK
jgi:hypothetical protein